MVMLALFLSCVLCFIVGYFMHSKINSMREEKIKSDLNVAHVNYWTHCDHVWGIIDAYSEPSFLGFHTTTIFTEECSKCEEHRVIKCTPIRRIDITSQIK